MEYFDSLIPISYIREYSFCPRVPWYLFTLKFQPPEQAWVRDGRDWHIQQSLNRKRRQYPSFKIPYESCINKYVYSEKYKIHGYIDEVLINDEEIIVIEYKVDKNKPTLGQKLQLLAYSIAAEETLQKKINSLLLIKGETRKKYYINRSDRLNKKLLVTLDGLKKVLNSFYMPSSSASHSKCDQCVYLRYCNDR